MLELVKCSLSVNFNSRMEIPRENSEDMTSVSSVVVTALVPSQQMYYEDLCDKVLIFIYSL